MKIKELEKTVNENANKIEKEKAYNLVWSVESILRKELVEYQGIYISDYNGVIKICTYGGYYGSYGVTVKIKKKLAEKKYERFFGYQTYWKIDKVEFSYDNEEFDTIEGMIEYNNKRKEREENAKQKKADSFIKELEEKGIDFVELMELAEKYDRFNYDQKKHIAEKYVGDKYFNYL